VAGQAGLPVLGAMVKFEREHEVRQLRPGVAGEPLVPAAGREVLEIDLARAAMLLLLLLLTVTTRPPARASSDAEAAQ
jgi:hypothetical protein